MTTHDASQDQILSMLDSIEEAIVEEAWSTSVRPPPPPLENSPGRLGVPLPIQSDPPIAAAPRVEISTARRALPDAPPKTSGSIVVVRGSTAQVLGQFQWGDTRGSR